MDETLRELDHRMNDRVDVWLLRRERDDQVLVAVGDEKTGDQFTIEVREGERPLDVFNHPYAYAAWHGVDIGAEAAPSADRRRRHRLGPVGRRPKAEPPLSRRASRGPCAPTCGP